MRKISFKVLKNIADRNVGLTNAEVLSQRLLYGDNTIVQTVGNPWIDLAKETLKDPMIWFLFSIGTIFFLLGDTTEGLTLFIAVLPLLLMDAFLNWRTQSSIKELKGQLASKLKVFRNSTESLIDSQDLVPGDHINISSNTIIPADGFFQNITDIKIDESVLTGESFPVKKQSISFNPFEMSSKDEMLVDNNILGFAGTRVLTGQGQFRVLFTGDQTTYGQIVKSISEMPKEKTPLQKSIFLLVK